MANDELESLGNAGQVGDLLTDSLYGELKKVALARLRAERPHHTLQATALVHEVWIKLRNNPEIWKHRDHFVRIAAKCMRQTLTDYARARGAQKRRIDGPMVSLGDAGVPEGPWSALSPEEMISLDLALTRLQEFDERQCLIVELRFFSGLTEDEIGDMLGLSARTVKRDWEAARGWLHGQLRRANPAGR